VSLYFRSYRRTLGGGLTPSMYRKWADSGITIDQIKTWWRRCREEEDIETAFKEKPRSIQMAAPTRKAFCTALRATWGETNNDAYVQPRHCWPDRSCH